jgi:flagellar protein FliT
MANHRRDGGGPDGGDSAGLIDHYEAIANASRQMLDAARAEDWAQVARIEQHCRELIATLKEVSSRATLSAAENRRRMVILRAILQDDAQIRVRAEPWLRDLEDFLVAARRQAPPKT